MAFLFDTDAVSEVLRARPSPVYIEWLRAVPREDQFISAVVAAELTAGAFRSARARFHLEHIERLVLSGVTVLPFDVAVARVYGEIEAGLEENGRPLADADLQVAATAIYHGLELVTGNLGRFETVPGIVLCRVLAEARPTTPEAARAAAAAPAPAPAAAAAPVPREVRQWRPEED